MYFKCSASAVGLLHEYFPKIRVYCCWKELTSNLAGSYVGVPKNATGMLLERHTNI